MATHILFAAKVLTTAIHLTRKHRLKKHCRDLLAEIDLNRAENLMIVSRPGEETLWGGGHLLTENYLVVCMTGGKQAVTVNEMKNALAISGTQSIPFAFREKNLRGQTSHWYFSRSNIKTVLRILMTAKKWKKIVTHNPDGEYGYRHNCLLSRFVTDTYKKIFKKPPANSNTLFYFGPYYDPEKMDNMEKSTPLSETVQAAKRQMIATYKTIPSLATDFGHMFHYENWTKQSDWTGSRKKNGRR